MHQQCIITCRRTCTELQQQRCRSSAPSVCRVVSVFDSGAVGPGSNSSRDAVGNSLRQTVHTHRASVHQAAKLVAALLRVAGITAGLVESNGGLPPGS